ncbi:LOW QUALITY PROTEIN: hypothetical protein OSB04_001710 [Centaurea solstitialis]|uniref:PB1-like domain-containing protein n=1 Tax=Centaurea solstitialis TaxID=347529 RepID=A0AA38WUK5_9ASTR|nr:LOW QUALITY PROTEIN: hypothetical protein OSB04_001710 [Centaurea solstitialis]
MVHTLWQVKTYHEGDQIDEYVDVYDAYPDLVALKIHHGGKFTKFPGRRYERGKIHIVDLVGPDKFSVLELEGMMKEIGYKSPRPTYYHFVVPGKDLDYGLHALGSDRDVIEILWMVAIFEIYTEHWVSRVNTYDRSPGVSKVVIEQLPDEVTDEVPPESKKRKRLLLEWKDEETFVAKETNVAKETDVAKEKPTDHETEKGAVAVDHLEGIDPSIFDDDFDPFFGAAMDNPDDVDGIDNHPDDVDGIDNHPDDVDGIDNNSYSDSDFEVEPQNVVEEMHVDMKEFNANKDLDAEWAEKGKGKVGLEKANVAGDVDAVEMDEMHSSTDDSDLEAERKAYLKS